MIKRLPSCNRTEALRLSLYHLITACCHMRLPVTVEIRRYLRSLPLQKACPWSFPTAGRKPSSFSPQLGSDFRKDRTRARLPPSPALFAFPGLPTLFVSAFSLSGSSASAKRP